MPEISFFIQTYNTAPYLKECIDSILAQAITITSAPRRRSARAQS